jgi:D-aspartate ligase
MSADPHPSVPAVVLGSGITALGVVRSLGRRGITPYLVCRAGDFAGRSRWRRSLRSEIAESAEPRPLATWLEQLDLERAVLVPCTDLWSTAVAGLPAGFSERFPSSMPSASILELLVDKALFARKLAELGVPHPRTIEIGSDGDLPAGDLDGYFLKPRNSQLFNQRYHTKAFSFRSRQEALERLGAIRGAGLEAVLQEYVPGEPTAHYFLDGFVDRSGRILAMFARQRLRMFPPDFGNSSLMVSVSLDEAAGAVESIERLLAGIGYRGIFSGEFKRDARSGEFKLLEVNSRPWWYIEFAAHCGVDVSVLAYRDALELPVEPVTSYRVGERCVLLPQEIRAFLHTRRKGSLSLGSWLRSWVGAVPTIFRWDDPLPAVALPSFLARRQARRLGGR